MSTTNLVTFSQAAVRVATVEAAPVPVCWRRAGRVPGVEAGLRVQGVGVIEHVLGQRDLRHRGEVGEPGRVPRALRAAVGGGVVLAAAVGNLQVELAVLGTVLQF